MYKTLLLIAFFGFNSVTAQVNNLADLLEISNLTVYGLTSELQGIWELERPTEKYSKDGKKVTGLYTYKFSSGKTKQTIVRQIDQLIESGIQQERTKFIFNDKALLNLIVKNLPYRGFEVRQKDVHKTVYHDGKTMVAITDDQYTDEPLQKGYMMVTIFAH